MGFGVVSGMDELDGSVDVGDVGELLCVKVGGDCVA